MDYRAEAGKRQRIDQLIEAVRNRWPAEVAAEVAAFIEDFYRSEAPGEALPAALEKLLTQASHPWRDAYRDALVERCGPQRGPALYAGFADAFSVAYQAGNLPAAAALDTERLAALTLEAPVGLSLYRPEGLEAGLLRLKIYLLGRQITLSEILPMLENMGAEVIDERPYDIHPTEQQPCWIRDLGLRFPAELITDEERARELFQSALTAVWHGQAENDGFNRLCLAAALD